MIIERIHKSLLHNRINVKAKNDIDLLPEGGFPLTIYRDSFV